MKLRKFFAAGLALFALSAAAQVNVEDIRIYINPGHGSWGPNNRHMATIGHDPIVSANPDTTDFFESNTNLQKALALFYRLKDYGFKNTTNGLDLTQNIVMSHVKCGPWPCTGVGKDYTDSGNEFNRTLSEIAAEVDANNIDMFISIHSNAASEGNTTNYLYFAMDGYASATGDKIATSKAMSLCGWNHRILDRHTMWTHYDYTMTAADLAAGKGKIGQQNLGVMNHSVPGYLVEGYFHTYQPSRHRGMNFDVDRLEGIDYARGVADYYGITKENVGDIYGVVRDNHTKFTHSLYTPNASTYDVYKPLNGVKVVLYNEAGDSIDEYTTDVNYNGAFVFRNLAPGKYTVKTSHPDYLAPTFTKPLSKTPEIVAIDVKAAKVAYPTVFIENKDYVPPTINYVNYPDSTAGKAGYTIFPSYNVKATASNLLAAKLEGKTVRRQLVRDGRVYVLALDSANEPYIYLADIKTSSVFELDTDTVKMGANGKLKISDIALTADHYLVACGMSGCHYDNSAASTRGEERGAVNIYKWAKDEATTLPSTCELWFTTKTSSNYTYGIIGRTMAFTGTTQNGKLIITSQHGTKTADIAMRMEGLLISEDKYIGDERLDTWASGYNETINKYFYSDNLSTSCNDYELMVSPLGEEHLFIDGDRISPMEFYFETTGAKNPATIVRNDSLVAPAVNGANYFRYAGKAFMVAPKLLADSNVVAGIQLFDITDGINNAKEVNLKGSDIEPVAYTYASAHGELELTLSADDKTVGADMVLYLLVDGKIYKFTESVTSVTPAAGGKANPFAYGLKSEYADGTLSVNYSLNADATNVKVHIKNAEGEIVLTQDMGAQEKGAYSAEISTKDLPLTEHTWEVEVEGEVKDTMVSFHDLRYYHPRGVDIDNNMESDYFGSIYVTEGMSTTNTTYFPASNGGTGLYIFNPDMTSVKNQVTGKAAFMGGFTYSFISYGADLARVRVAEDGRIFVTRCGKAGDYIAYAKNQGELVANDKFYSLLAGGSVDATTYEYNTADGFLASANIGLDVKGAGENLKLLAHSGNATTFALSNCSGSRTSEYALGTAEVLPMPTQIESLSNITIAPQVTNVEYDSRGGIWYCQYRATPTNEQPSLIYVDAEGNRKFFEGTGGLPRGGGGIRLSPDESKIAIATSKTQFTIFNVFFDETGAPALQEETVVTHGIGTNVYDFAWDLAGNLYIVGNSGEHFKGFALPRTENAVTKAASKYAFVVEVPQSRLPEFAPVSEMTVTKVWESNEGIPAAAYGAYRFGSGVDDNILTTTASRQIMEIDAAGKRVLADLTAFFEATPELHVVNTVIEKIDTISVDTAYNETETGTDTVVTVLADTTWAEVKTLDAMGTAITVDDAGNIIVNVGFPSTTSSSEFIIVPADGSEYRFMSLDLASISSANARVDQVGRVIGDVLSAEGAYMWLNPNGATQVPVIKIKEGAMVADESQVADISDLKNSTSCLAQPAIFNVADIDAMMEEDADISATFWWRNRSTAGVVNGWQYNDSEGMYKFDKTVTVSKGAASNEGFATFNLQGNTYFVVPTTSGSARTAEFVITDVEGNVLYTLGSTAAAKDQYGALAAYELDDNTAIIYHLLPGVEAGVYAFQLPEKVGVEGIVADEAVVAAPAVYYNLQGAKVVNPTKGIYIVKRGNKVTKEYIR